MRAAVDFVHKRPRLWIAGLAGAVATLLLPPQTDLIVRILAGWNLAVWLYLLLVGWLMVRAHHTQVRAVAQQEDKSAVIVLAVMSLAAVASLAAIIYQLSTARTLTLVERLTHYALTGSTIAGAWCLIATLFCLHYARLFYQSPANSPALQFPDAGHTPDYWDFLYFAVTIAVAGQTADISLKSQAMRKTVLAQSVLSYFFNAAVLGFSVNIAASVIGG